jgi:hypothetical protein
MDYVIAIPTYRRATLFAAKTLAYLQTTDALADGRLHLFLSDDEDARAYSALPGKHVVTGARNVVEKFNAIHNHFPEGTHVLVMEDDVALVECPQPGTNQKRPLQALDAVVRRGFEEIPLGGLWGIAPHDNAFYMTGKVKHGLFLVVAHAFGFVSTGGDPYLAIRGPSKTDYERTCRYYVRYGEVVRIDSVGVKTNSYSAAGGMQADHTREERFALERASCEALVYRFPLLLERNRKKDSPFDELKFLRQKYAPSSLRAWQAHHEAKLDA